MFDRMSRDVARDIKAKTSEHPTFEKPSTDGDFATSAIPAPSTPRIPHREISQDGKFDNPMDVSWFCVCWRTRVWRFEGRMRRDFEVMESGTRVLENKRIATPPEGSLEQHTELNGRLWWPKEKDFGKDDGNRRRTSSDTVESEGYSGNRLTHPLAHR